MKIENILNNSKRKNLSKSNSDTFFSHFNLTLSESSQNLYSQKSDFDSIYDVTMGMDGVGYNKNVVVKELVDKVESLYNEVSCKLAEIGLENCSYEGIMNIDLDIDEFYTEFGYFYESTMRYLQYLQDNKEEYLSEVIKNSNFDYLTLETMKSDIERNLKITQDKEVIYTSDEYKRKLTDLFELMKRYTEMMYTLSRHLMIANDEIRKRTIINREVEKYKDYMTGIFVVLVQTYTTYITSLLDLRERKE